MGSVQGYTDCPNCSFDEAMQDYKYKTDEEFISCPKCGWMYHRYLERDDEANLITKDGSDNLIYSNLIVKEYCLDNPYGAFYVGYKNGRGVGGSVKTEDNLKQIIDALRGEEQDILFATLSRFVEGGYSKEYIIGSSEHEQQYFVLNGWSRNTL